MQPVPMPQVLDPDRLLMPERDDFTNDEHKQQADAALAELKRTCDYGQALWHQLGAARAYLHDHTPSDPNDGESWQAWSVAYADVTSSLAGVTGDNGFGAQEAQVIAQSKRNQV